MSQEHGGNIFEFARRQGCRIDEVTDFSANINPLGMSPLAIRAIQDPVPSLIHYPDRNCAELREALAKHHGLKTDQILVGNGSTELIHLLPRALGFRKVLISAPTFSEYETAAKLSGCEIAFFQLRGEDHFKIFPSDLLKATTECINAVFLCNPNNPTGQLLLKDESLRIIELAYQRGIMVIVDEALMDYTEPDSVIQETSTYPNLIVLRSFTKFYGMPGLRVGYLVADKEILQAIERFKPPWSVNHLALLAARASLMDEPYIEKSRQVTEEERNYLWQTLSDIQGITVFPSYANYLLLKLSERLFRMEEVERRLIHEKILVRNCGSFRGLSPWYIRIAVRSRGDNEMLVRLLRGVASDRLIGTAS